MHKETHVATCTVVVCGGGSGVCGGGGGLNLKLPHTTRFISDSAKQQVRKKTE